MVQCSQHKLLTHYPFILVELYFNDTNLFSHCYQICFINNSQLTQLTPRLDLGSEEESGLVLSSEEEAVQYSTVHRIILSTKEEAVQHCNTILSQGRGSLATFCNEEEAVYHHLITERRQYASISLSCHEEVQGVFQKLCSSKFSQYKIPFYPLPHKENSERLTKENLGWDQFKKKHPVV